MKTNKEIFEKFLKNPYEEQKWYSEEEIKEAIVDVKKWEHHNLFKDWEIELQNKLFNKND